MRHGLTDDEIDASTRYDPWFLARIREIVDEEARLRQPASPASRTRSAASSRWASPTPASPP